MNKTVLAKCNGCIYYTPFNECLNHEECSREIPCVVLGCLTYNPKKVCNEDCLFLRKRDDR